ncbi:MAG: lipopolysaccharide heptosyltransferase II [candidate division KSB1 bacterium]|nr:lipopolysaccharide heptosyltransferase II [candidate division KSB1 bacterium]
MERRHGLHSTRSRQPFSEERLRLDRVSRILVVRFSSIGDILLTTPLLRVLAEKVPEVQIDYLTKRSFSPLLHHNPRVSRIWELSEPYGLRELWRLARLLHGNRYDLIVNVHKNLRTAWLRLYLPGRWSTYRKEILRRTLYVHLKIRSLAPRRPVRERYFDAVRPLGLHDDHGPLEYYLTEEERGWAQQELGRRGLPPAGLWLGLAIGAGRATKRWPVEHFAQLGHSLRKRWNAAFLIFGDRRDHRDGQYLERELDGAAVDFTGQTDLRQTAALMSLCEAVVSNDSGLMHLADALGKKLVAVFGGTTPELGFAPQGRHVRIVERKEVRCRPCSHIGRNRCPRGHFRCMRDVRPEDVEAAVTSLLDSGNPPEGRRHASWPSASPA